MIDRIDLDFYEAWIKEHPALFAQRVVEFLDQHPTDAWDCTISRGGFLTRLSAVKKAPAVDQSPQVSQDLRLTSEAKHIQAHLDRLNVPSLDDDGKPMSLIDRINIMIRKDTPNQGVAPGYVAVQAGVLNMVINALRRDAEEGRLVRGEMADELLDATPIDARKYAAKKDAPELSALRDVVRGLREKACYVDEEGEITDALEMLAHKVIYNAGVLVNLEAEIESLTKQRDHFQRIAAVAADKDSSNVWYWQGDGTDHPESLVNSLNVVIRADQLRALMSARSVDWTQAGKLMEAASSAASAGFVAGTTNWAAHVCRAMGATVTQQAAPEQPAPVPLTETFAEWLCREMPPGTVISDPAWWAPKIERALRANGIGKEQP